MATLGLRVSWVLDLYPAASIVFVDAQLALGDDALQIPSANLLKESLAMLLDVLRVEDALAGRRLDQRSQAPLTFQEGCLSKILAVKPQQIEGLQDRLTFAP